MCAIRRQAWHFKQTSVFAKNDFISHRLCYRLRCTSLDLEEFMPAAKIGARLALPVHGARAPLIAKQTMAVMA